MASSFGLSVLGGGSRQFIITLEENKPTEIPRGMLIDTATRSDVAVSTAITLLSYSETQTEAEKAGGINFIVGRSSSTGNGGLIPLGGRSLESFAGNSEYSEGASTIFVSTSGSGEKVLLTYDTQTLGVGSLSAPINKTPHVSGTGKFAVSFSNPATTSDLGSLASWTASNTASDIVIAVAADDPLVYLICAREKSAVQRQIGANYISTADEDCMRLLIGNNQSVNIKFADQATGPPIEFIPGFSPNAGKWVAFPVQGSTPGTAQVLEALFGSTTPTSGAESISDVSGFQHQSTKRRAVKCIFNAVQMLGGEQSRYGGGMSIY